MFSGSNCQFFYNSKAYFYKAVTKIDEPKVYSLLFSEYTISVKLSSLIITTRQWLYYQGTTFFYDE